MLVLVAAIAGAILVGLAAGRRLGRSPGRRRGPAPAATPVGALLLLAAGAVGLLAGARVDQSPLDLILTDGGYGLLLVFAIANRRHPGLLLITVGLAANLAVIAMNGGMPVKGLPAGVPEGRVHHGLSTRDHLSFLGDDIGLAGETLSAGDITLAAGAALAAFFWLEPVPDARRRVKQPARRGAESG